MSKTSNKFFPKVRKRAVQIVLDGEGPHGSGISLIAQDPMIPSPSRYPSLT